MHVSCAVMMLRIIFNVLSRYLAFLLLSSLHTGVAVVPNDILFPGKKCVILGQDPYHQPSQGHGLAFSVRKGVKPPPSLVNIFKEAMDDIGIPKPKHGNLECWAKQGVLLMNTVLTVRSGEANSHAKMGWEDFTDEIIRAVNEREHAVVFLLWGRAAAQKATCIDKLKHSVILSSHPR